MGSSRSSLRSTLRAAIAWVALVASGANAAPMSSTSSSSVTSPTSPPLDPATQALVDEIAALEKRDFSADPVGAGKELEALRARIDASGKVPALSRGDFESAVAATLFYSGNIDGAARKLDDSAALYRSGGAGEDRIALVYSNQSAIFSAANRQEDAERAARQALAMRQHFFGPRHSAVAATLYNLAFTLRAQGRYQEAVPVLRDAVDQSQEFEQDKPATIILRLAGLCTLLSESGQGDEAIPVCRRAEQMAAEKLGERHQLYSAALNNLGSALNTAGRFGEAIPILRETLRARQISLGERSIDTAISIRNLAYALQATGHPEESEALNLQAVEIVTPQRLKAPANVYQTMLGALAMNAAARQDWQAYDERMAAALAEADARMDDTNPERAYSHLQHANVLEQRGRLGEAREIAERWVPVLRQRLIPGHRNRIWGELLLARLRQSAGAPTSDVWAIADPEVKALTERLSDLSIGDQQRAQEAETNLKAALLYLKTGMAIGDRERVFHAVQLINMSELALGQQRSAVARNATQTGKEIDAAISSGRSVSELEGRLARAMAANDPARIANLQAKLGSAQAIRDEAVATLRREDPAYSSRYRPQPVGLDQITATLTPGDLLVMPVEGFNEAWVLTLDRHSGLTWHPIDQAHLRNDAAEIRLAIEAGDSTQASFPYLAAHRLFRTLFPDGVPQNGRVLLYGGRSVANLPFSLLLTEDYAGDLRSAPWLVRRASNQVIGNLSLREVSRPDHLRQRQVSMIGVGGVGLPGNGTPRIALASLFRSGVPQGETIAALPPLPNAAAELSAIGAALPGKDAILVGPDSAEERLKKTDMSHVDVLVFATHGLVSGEMKDLWEPALLVGTAPGSGEDGLLGASEIAGLRLKADWVILSACNTAAGDSPGAPPYSGLATAFAQAGARGLMLSHWRVRDDAAARLTAATVQGTAQGLTRAEALRRAELALIADPTVPDAAHPAIWAPFVVIEN